MAKTFTARAATQLTEDQINDLTGPELVAAFNAMSEMAKVKPIKKFSDRATADKRVRQLRKQVGVMFLERDLADADTPPSAKAKRATSKPARPVVTRPETVSGRCQDLINQGLTNDAVWAVVQPEFKLGLEKRGYPAWNRSMMARKAKAAELQGK